MNKIKDITGIILAGGKSSRMGTDKAFLKYKNKYFIEIAYDLLKDIFDNVIIIANDLEKFSFLKCKVFPDVYKDKGPLGGIHSGLLNSQTDWNFIMSCDVPLMNKKFILSLNKIEKTGNAIIPKTKTGIHPLAGFYHKNIIHIIEELFILDENLSLMNLLKSINTIFLDIDEISNAEHEFLKNLKNINTLYDLNEISGSNNIKK